MKIGIGLKCLRNGCTVAIALGSGVALAFPDRPVTLIVPFAAGGGADVIARALQGDLAKSLGQPVVVVNKDGAGGTIGTAAVAQAKPDGYTIGLIPAGPLVTQPHMRSLPYGVDAWAPICQAYDGGNNVLMVAPTSQFKTVKDVLASAKANPGRVTYASPGVGSIPHLAMADLARASGTELLHVPYKGSTGVMNDMLAGVVELYADQANLIARHNMRPLSVFSEKRLPELPEVPTLRELGYDVGNYSNFGSLVAPKGTPKGVVAKLEQACHDAVHTDAFRTFLQNQKLPFSHRGADDLQRHIRASYSTMGKVIQEAGIKLEK